MQRLLAVGVLILFVSVTAVRFSNDIERADQLEREHAEMRDEQMRIEAGRTASTYNPPVLSRQPSHYIYNR